MRSNIKSQVIGERYFQNLLEQWRADEKPTSMMIDRVTHPAYLRIISLGEAAIPLILSEMAHSEDPWFMALEAITGDNPVAIADRGRIPKMIEAWLAWGQSHGYLA